MNIMRSVCGSVRSEFVARSSLVVVIFLLAATSTAVAQQYFQTPAEAAQALVTAVRTGAQEAIVRVLGRGGRDIATSGDAVADAEMRKRFLAAYDEKNEITMDGDDKAIMVVGQDAFPFPIPIVRRAGRWLFDTVEGRREILHRRIGRNETHAIQVSLAYVDAQLEYAEEDRTGTGPGVYARRFVSQPGRKDGLYWPTSEGEPASPLGDLFAQASNEGYRVTGGQQPFHGYFYKILTAQGPAAPGGAVNYVVRGRMIGGFALVAFPASYRNTGVMTFVVNHTGVVYEKDLGWQTGRIASRMTLFNPDKTWNRVDPDAIKATRAIRTMLASRK
jgi:hypothetical protein